MGKPIKRHRQSFPKEQRIITAACKGLGLTSCHTEATVPESSLLPSDSIDKHKCTAVRGGPVGQKERRVVAGSWGRGAEVRAALVVSGHRLASAL